LSTDLLVQIYVFVLALFVGFEVITKVPPTLHTPLMSGSNAISGVTLVGAIIAAGSIDIELSGLWDSITVTSILGFVAIIFATINVVGGFLVTDRMLKMFKR
jgi:NAD(P) transhydrogenase subunit alpha|tara:strand:+ start:6402 stop:6707 length:306 start_codon:yes stop_codon:yes gene_type:complete